MDDQMIRTLLREGDETAPADLRDAIRGLVRAEPIATDGSEDGRTPRRNFLWVAAAAMVVLAVGAIFAVGQGRDTTTITDTAAPSGTDNTPSTSTPSSVTTPSTAAVRADRFGDLPDEDPVTLELRPGELWPMSDIVQNRGLKGLSATEEQVDGETVRTVIYTWDRCDVVAAADGDDDPVCPPVMIVEARFGAAVPSNESTEPTIPLTEDGSLWAEVSTDPDGYPLCLGTRPFCPAPVTFGRRIGDVPIRVTMTGGFDQSSLDSWTNPGGGWPWSIYLFDEASGEPLAIEPRPLREIVVSEEFPWFRGTLFGPVVAVTDDGDHELRAQSNGDDIALYTSQLDRAQTLPKEWMAAPADSPIQIDWAGSSSSKIVYGITDTEVVDIVFESVDGERLVTATGDLSGTFRSRFFIATLPWYWSPTGSDELRVLARDANGNEVACFNASAWGGISWGGERCSRELASVEGQIQTPEDQLGDAEERDMDPASSVPEVDERLSVDDEERDMDPASSVPEVDERLSVDDPEDSQSGQPNPGIGVVIYGDGEISCPDHRANDESLPVGTIVYQPEEGGIRITITLIDAAPNVNYGVALWRDESCIRGTMFRQSDEFMTTDGDGAGELDVLFTGIAPGTYRLNVNLVAEDVYEDPRHREMGTTQFTEVVVP